ncbi:hypothetical protein [Floridanema evergladense]|uniref:Uncharacterized protein n=1 Tax=Floridaenema evergladense BLCC-F167 TaxID=3153639 RepID=A0ABV4WEK2_9CYAN
MENELSRTKVSSNEQEQKPGIKEAKDVSQEIEVSLTPEQQISSDSLQEEDDGGRGPKHPPGPGRP